MKKTAFVLFAILTLNISGISAQSLDEAGAAFNAGIEFSKNSKFAEAIASYEKTISICKQLGDEGVELQFNAEQQLPTAYYNLGKGFFEAKDFAKAIPNFEKSAELADQNGEAKTADAARTYLAGIYYAQGNADLKADALDAAIEKYNKSLSYKPSYYKSHYGLGLVYKKQENLPLMKENLDKAIEMAGDDAKTIGNAKDAAASAYQKAGALSLQTSKYNDAVQHLVASQEYDVAEPRTYFYLAIAYNGLSKPDEAIEAANKAVELQTEDKSDIYFELAKAYETKADQAAACENYRKVTAGNNLDAAKYQIEQVLKCQ
jgi:tetratricopeptide (TPR) repeat protein